MPGGEWLGSWNAQQDLQVTMRPARLELLAAVAEAAGGAHARVLDLACGPGAVAQRILGRLPEAHVVLLDVDPVLLRIAREAFDGDGRVEIVSADLRRPGWSSVFEVGFDAVVTATALHWLAREELARVYGEVLAVLRPGGFFANSDHLHADGGHSWGEQVLEAIRRQQGSDLAGALEWDEWWALLERDGRFANELAQRRQVFATSHPHGEHMTVREHRALLEEAGFVEVGELWRVLDDAILVARRPL